MLFSRKWKLLHLEKIICIIPLKKAFYISWKKTHGTLHNRYSIPGRWSVPKYYNDYVDLHFFLKCVKHILDELKLPYFISKRSINNSNSYYVVISILQNMLQNSPQNSVFGNTTK